MESYDFYKDLASKFFNKPSDQITLSERKQAKMSFFRTIYGGRDKNTALILDLFEESPCNNIID